MTPLCKNGHVRDELTKDGKCRKCLREKALRHYYNLDDDKRAKRRYRQTGYTKEYRRIHGRKRDRLAENAKRRSMTIDEYIQWSSQRFKSIYEKKQIKSESNILKKHDAHVVSYHKTPEYRRLKSAINVTELKDNYVAKIFKTRVRDIDKETLRLARIVTLIRREIKHEKQDRANG